VHARMEAAAIDGQAEAEAMRALVELGAEQWRSDGRRARRPCRSKPLRDSSPTPSADDQRVSLGGGGLRGAL